MPRVWPSSIVSKTFVSMRFTIFLAERFDLKESPATARFRLTWGSVMRMIGTVALACLDLALERASSAKVLAD